MEASELHTRAMASAVHLRVVGPVPGAVPAALGLLDRLEQRWSRFVPTSDITRLNHAAGRPTEVAPETALLVERLRDAWMLTGGRFDPTVLRALVAHGYRSSITDPARHTTLPPARVPAGHLGDVRIDGTVVTLPAGLALDPGGLGKGLAADLLVAGLLGAGCAGALVNIGGDLAAGGQAPDPADDGWLVTVEHPDTALADLGTFALDAGGVATSSTRSRRWRHHGAEQHHTIDPSSGRPSRTDLASVTVVAPSGWLAEAHATAALLSGRGGVLAHLARHDLSGLAVTTDGEILATADLLPLTSCDHEGVPV